MLGVHRSCRPTENLGFAGGNNASGRRGRRGEYLLLLNPDTVVLDRAIEVLLVEFAQGRRRRMESGEGERFLQTDL